MFMVSPITVRSWEEKGWLNAETTADGHRRYLQQEVERFAQERGLTLKPAPPSALQLLIVDDDQQLTAYLEELLLEVSPAVQTHVANDGFEAGLMIREFTPDVVLLDLRMPGMDGYQVCQRIKLDPALRAIRILGMTGYPSAENIERILAMGAEHCFSKPINTQELFRLLGVQRAHATN